MKPPPRRLFPLLCLLLQRINANCPTDGYYFDATKTDAQTHPCAGYVLCEAGNFCESLIKHPCPAGTFGPTEGLEDRESCQICPQGFYCPEQSEIPIECGSPAYFCPEQSSQPTPVALGSYSYGGGTTSNTNVAQKACEPGFYCTDGVKKSCPAGKIGVDSGLSTAECNQDCPPGFYCPPQSSELYAHSCGGDPSVFCPAGTGTPVQVKKGYYSVQPEVSVAPFPGAANEAPCEPGYYCPYDTVARRSTGEKFPCPGGRYGDRLMELFPSCTGLCQERYYCPPGSTNARQEPCGDDMYCPAGSAAPVEIKRGYYIPEGTTEISPQQYICPKGSYCQDGIRHSCPAGRYGAEEGLTSSMCSGLCSAGYYCETGSTSETEHECGHPGVYCPPGSSSPTPVDLGHFSVGSHSTFDQLQSSRDASTRTGQEICSPGHYCIGGIVSTCAAGLYGGTFGLHSENCSGECFAGYYCPIASVSPTQMPCGNPRFHCPQGSEEPTPTDRGFCSTGGTGEQTRTSQVIAPIGHYAWGGECYKCPAGSYGDAEGLSQVTCSGLCEPGYYCPAGSISAKQIECGGPEFYCPGKNSGPIRVAEGFYTSVYGSEVCQAGQYRDMSSTAPLTEHVLGVSPIAVNYGDFLYLYALCKTCPVGTWKAVEGDDLSLCIPCPSLTSTSSADGRTCDCFRPSGGNPYNDTTHYLEFDGADCIAVPKTYRTLEKRRRLSVATTTRFTRTRQYECEAGYYCLDGIRYRCPAGYFGYAPRETSPFCSGQCDAGYYCPLASTRPTQLKCGAINVYCPRASPVPIPVHPGYYTDRTSSRFPDQVSDLQESFNAMTRDRELICEKGYFCVNGKRYLCPAGRYGSLEGETSPYCTGACFRGYKCPPGSTSPMEHHCGSPGVVCRTGCHFPRAVSTGYYTLGPTNTTRFYERPCEKGHYCVGGIKYQCPEGRYGDTDGLTSPSCSGLCAPGYRCPSSSSAFQSTRFACGDKSVYCPAGTGAQPVPVSVGYYTIGGSDESTRHDQTQCEPGHYCVGGERFRCRAGRYGSAYGLGHEDCSGWCTAGYACPIGSTSPRQHECPIGTYSYTGAGSCMPCPNFVTRDDHFAHTCRTSRDCCFSA